MKMKPGRETEPMSQSPDLAVFAVSLEIPHVN